MPNSEISESESEGKASSEEETENETANENGGSRNQEKISDYEMQRLKRIEENKRRMEALGLHKMANSLMGSVQKAHKKSSNKKGKKKMVDEDDEYNPTQDDEEMSSSEEEEDENDEEFSPSKKNKKKVKKNTSTPKKRGPVQKPTFDSDFVEDDDALMQAIALSLQDSAVSLDARGSPPPQTSGSHLTNTAPSKSPATLDTETDKRKENSPVQNDSGKRKRKKSITSRVQMTEDEMIMHFFQFDGKEKLILSLINLIWERGFTFRDIRRLAAAHDFTWSEKEMADMISYFDSDGDGKISLDDFRNILCRCNMLKGPDDGVTGNLELGN